MREQEHRQSLRHFLAALEQQGALLRLSEPIDPRFEVSACLEELRDGPAVLFENPIGNAMPIVANVLNSRARIAAGLGTDLAGLQGRIIQAIEHPLPCRKVASGPCQEIEVSEPDLSGLPIPSFFEGESGPYITAGAIVAVDRASGQRNLSFARLKPLGGSRAFIGIAPNHHLAVMARAAAARGEQLPIAVTIGNHPAVMMAAALYLGLGDDEMEVAGALLGEPVEVIPTREHGLPVPAHCEIVLEGRIDTTRLVEEGPVSEYHGLYEDYGRGQLVIVDRLTRRRDALFQAIQPGFHPEHALIGGVSIAAGLARHAGRLIPSLGEVAVGMGGAGRLHAVVALRETRPGNARKAMFALWSAVNLVKRVVVVDDDIDVWDPLQVEWAMATRMQADRDILVVPGVRTDRSEPLESGSVIAKLGIDATRRAGDRDDWRRAEVPAATRAKLRQLLARHGFGPTGKE
jgi:2,5-furandicarboxylate decarboxylase 1